MIEARLAAQRRVAKQLNLGASELEHFQRVLKFAGAEDLLRLGDKDEAIKLLRGNWRGAPSIGAKLRVLARVVAPKAVNNWRKRRHQSRATQRYGRL
jgi:hypothetical protein